MPRCDLVLEGGGVRGIALVGAVEVLEEQGYIVSRVAGSSAGSIVAALVAAGMPASEMARLVRGLDYDKFLDPPLWVRLLGPLQIVGKGISLLRHAGMYEGRYFTEWLTRQLAERGVRTFADLRMDDADSGVADDQRYRLVVTASDVTASRLRYLPWDYPRLGYDPDTVAVAEAVRASMSIPFFFKAKELPHPASDVPTTLVDGAVLSNFPITIFDRTDGQAPRWPTFGIKLTAHDDLRTSSRGLFGTFKAVLRTMLDAHDAQYLDDPAVVARTIFIDADQVDSRDFDLTPEQVESLYQSGRQAAARFLQTWDWDAYQRRYGKPVSLPEVIAAAPEAAAARRISTRRAPSPEPGRAAAPGSRPGAVTGTSPLRPGTGPQAGPPAAL